MSLTDKFSVNVVLDLGQVKLPPIFFARRPYGLPSNEVRVRAPVPPFPSWEMGTGMSALALAPRPADIVSLDVG